MNSMRGLLAPEHRRAYLAGGHAIVTLSNPATGNRFTYKITKPEPREGLKPVWFVGLLSGPDNLGDYRYMGIFNPEKLTLTFTYGSKISATAPSAIAFNWLLKHLLDPRVDLWHEGTCCRCGRVLTVPESIAAGIGPTCAEKGGF